MSGSWAAVGLIVACALIGGGLYVRQLVRDERRHAEEDLAAVAESKIRLVTDWREERLADARSIGAHHFVARAASLAKSSAAARADLAAWCNAWLDHREYRGAAVLDARGDVLAFAGPPPGEEHRADAGRLERSTLSDLGESGAGELRAEVLVPLVLRTPAGPRRVGLVVLRSEPADHLFPLLERWPIASRTGEILLVRRKGASAQVVSASRRTEAEPFAVDFPLTRIDLPAVRAARGEHGISEGVDLRRQRVVAASWPIPGTDWSLVAQVQRREIFESILERAGWALLAGAALAVAALSGAFVWWRALIRAVRAVRREAELRQLALERHFAHLTRHTNDILLLSDGGLRIVEANDRAVAAYGYPRVELLGKRLEEILAPRARLGLEARIRAIAAGQGEVIETAHRRRDGSTFPVEASSRVIDIEGERYYQSVIRDVTERRALERKLQQSEQRLEAALEASGHSIWDWDVRRDEVWASPTLLRMLGCRSGDLSGGDALRRIFHPEDRAATAESWDALLAGRKPRFEAAMRVLAGDGEWRRVTSRSRVVERDGSGRPLRVMGILSADGAAAGRDRA